MLFLRKNRSKNLNIINSINLVLKKNVAKKATNNDSLRNFFFNQRELVQLI